MALKETLATNLRRLRHARRWTQEELAERAGLSARYVGSLERSKVAASVIVVERLAAAFEIDPLALLLPRRD